MKKFNQIAEFGKKLMANSDRDEVLHLIADEAKKLVHAERCSLFIADPEAGMLWTKLSDGVERIVIDYDAGVVGDTCQRAEPQIVNEPYDDKRFLSMIDKKTGYETKNILSVPIFNSKREVMGVLQLLNKHNADFDKEDLELLTFFANYVSGTLELVLMDEK